MFLKDLFSSFSVQRLIVVPSIVRGNRFQNLLQYGFHYHLHFHFLEEVAGAEEEHYRCLLPLRA
jgi:hypothetical protein